MKNLTYSETGTGSPVLLLHGGGGPQTVTSFAELLASTAGLRVITPIHPGFGGTERPAELDSVGGLAALYIGLLDELDLHDVTVIGNSLGGWIASELALLRSPRVARIILVDAVGIDVPEHPPIDFFSLPLPAIADYSFFEPDQFRIDPSKLPPEALAVGATNREALAVYGGDMVDPTLAGRLADVDVPTLVIWGDADRIVDADYGRAFAAAIPGARFELLPRTGHLPQVETPDQLAAAIVEFAPLHAA